MHWNETLPVLIYYILELAELAIQIFSNHSAEKACIPSGDNIDSEYYYSNVTIYQELNIALVYVINGFDMQF